MVRQALTSKESELPMIFRSDWGILRCKSYESNNTENIGFDGKNIKKKQKKQSNQKKQTRKPKPRKKTRKTKKTAENAGFAFF